MSLTHPYFPCAMVGVARFASSDLCELQPLAGKLDLESALLLWDQMALTFFELLPSLLGALVCSCAPDLLFCTQVLPFFLSPVLTLGVVVVES